MVATNEQETSDFSKLVRKYNGFSIPWKELRSCPCPECGKKMLHTPGHPHAFGWKDYGKIQCRSCKTIWTLKNKE